MSVGALDSATISQLKADAANRPDQNLDEVSRRFEELFVNMLVKSMRQAVVKSDLFNSDAKDTYQQLFDQEISKEIARSGGLGLSDVIRDQLSRGASKKNIREYYEIGNTVSFPLQPVNSSEPKGIRLVGDDA